MMSTPKKRTQKAIHGLMRMGRNVKNWALLITGLLLFAKEPGGMCAAIKVELKANGVARGNAS